MPFRIRTASESDLPLILTFIRDLAIYEKLEHKVVATDEKLRATLFGNPRFAEVLIAEEDETPVGFALFFHNYSTFAGRPGIYLEDLYVRPAARGKGVGRALLAHLADLALARGCARLEWAVLDWNRAAIAFYESLGARAMDEWTVYRLSGETLRRASARSR